VYLKVWKSATYICCALWSSHQQAVCRNVPLLITVLIITSERDKWGVNKICLCCRCICSLPNTVLRHTVVAFSEIFKIYFLVFHHKHELWTCVHVHNHKVMHQYWILIKKLFLGAWNYFSPVLDVFVCCFSWKKWGCHRCEDVGSRSSALGIRSV